MDRAKGQELLWILGATSTGRPQLPEARRRPLTARAPKSGETFKFARAGHGRYRSPHSSQRGAPPTLVECALAETRRNERLGRPSSACPAGPREAKSTPHADKQVVLNEVPAGEPVGSACSLIERINGFRVLDGGAARNEARATACTRLKLGQSDGSPIRTKTVKSSIAETVRRSPASRPSEADGPTKDRLRAGEILVALHKRTVFSELQTRQDMQLVSEEDRFGLENEGRMLDRSSAGKKKGGCQYSVLIKIEKAANLRAADRNGLSDPYCMCELLGKSKTKRRTTTAKRTLNPTWNEKFVIEDFTFDDNIGFKVYDEDLDADDLLGSIVIKGEKLESEISISDTFDLKESAEFAQTAKRKKAEKKQATLTVQIAFLDEDGKVAARSTPSVTDGLKMAFKQRISLSHQSTGGSIRENRSGSTLSHAAAPVQQQEPIGASTTPASTEFRRSLHQLYVEHGADTSETEPCAPGAGLKA